MHDLLKDLSHLANTKHIRVTRKAKQIAGSYQNNIAEQNKMVVLPALRQLSSAALSEEKEAEIVSSLLVELTLAQAKVLAMLGSSDKALRKAVAKAAVLLWYAHFDPHPFPIPTFLLRFLRYHRYAHFDPHQIAVKTYLRKGKEKLAVTWSYRAADGARKERPRCPVQCRSWARTAARGQNRARCSRDRDI